MPGSNTIADMLDIVPGMFAVMFGAQDHYHGTKESYLRWNADCVVGQDIERVVKAAIQVHHLMDPIAQAQLWHAVAVDAIVKAYG